MTIWTIPLPTKATTERTFTEQSTDSYENQSNTFIPIFQLVDVQPDDWSFQALELISERYGCLDENSFLRNPESGSFTRNEFAIILSNCLDRLSQQTTESSLGVSSEDLLILQRLQSEFSPQLAAIRNQVNQLDNRSNLLETQQFSTTTRLEGEVVLAVAGVIGEERADQNNESIDRTLVGGNRVRLELLTSFTGSDQLRLRLQARDIPELENVTGTQMSNLGFDGSNGNNIELDRLDYEFAIGDRASAVVSLAGGGLGDYVSTVNPLFSGSSDGAISTFGRENPIRRQGGAPGVGLTYELSEAVSLEVGYVASQATNPEVGIAQSPYGAIAQITVEPSDTTRFSVTYLRSFNGLDTGTGSVRSGDPFDGDSEAMIANSFGAEVSFDLNEAVIGGRVGFIQANAKDLAANPSADIFTWAVLAGFSELGGEGNLAGLVIGQPPRITRNQYAEAEQAASWHLEAFYQAQINDRILITPGIIILLNPEHSANNAPIYVGTIRATFSF
ncbi:iron uptake porin [Egbenema bharatensis]|uniref:iron uptake porin n=1 Tax=Egbenema bharatensis TaxID=3463334 RepID=UPI003A8554B9